MSVVKNCIEVWSRLFDHKPFLQAELNSFVHEFEDSRKDREIVNLLDVLNTECEISNQLDALSNLQGTILHTIDEKINNCVKQTDELLKCKKVESEKSILEVRRKQRTFAWETYKEGMEPKFVQFEDEFKKELDQIKKIYDSQSKSSRSN